MEDNITKHLNINTKAPLKVGQPPPSPVARYNSTDNTMLECNDIFADLMEVFEARRYEQLEVDESQQENTAWELTSKAALMSLSVRDDDQDMQYMEMDDVFFTPKEGSSTVSPTNLNPSAKNQTQQASSVFTYAPVDIAHSVQNEPFIPGLTPLTPRQQRSTRRDAGSIKSSNTGSMRSTPSKMMPSYTPRSISTPKQALGSASKRQSSSSTPGLVFQSEHDVQNNHTHNTLIQQLAQPEGTKHWLKSMLYGKSELFETIAQVSVRPPSPTTIEKYFAVDVDSSVGALKGTKQVPYRNSVRHGVVNLLLDIEALSKLEFELRQQERRIAAAQGRQRRQDEARQEIQRSGECTVPLSPTSQRLWRSLGPGDVTSTDVFLQTLFSVYDDESESDSIQGQCRPWLLACNRAYLDHSLDHCGGSREIILRSIAESKTLPHNSTNMTSPTTTAAPQSPRSFYAQKKTSRLGDPAGILSPRSLQTFLRSIEEGDYMDACDCHDKWFYAQTQAISATGYYVRFDGWPEQYNETIPFSAAPAKIAPLGTRARKADRRLADRTTLFDLAAAERKQPSGLPRTQLSPRSSPRVDASRVRTQGTVASQRLASAKDALAELTTDMQVSVVKSQELLASVTARSEALAGSLSGSGASLPFPILVWLLKLVHLGMYEGTHQHVITLAPSLELPALMSNLKDAEDILFKDEALQPVPMPVVSMQPLLTARQSLSQRSKQPLLPVGLECLWSLCNLACVAVQGQAPAYSLQSRETINFLQLLVNISFQGSLWCQAIDAEISCKDKQQAAYNGNLVPPTETQPRSLNDKLLDSLSIHNSFEKLVQQPGAWCFTSSKLPLSRGLVSAHIANTVVDTLTRLLHSDNATQWSSAVSKLAMSSLAAIPSVVAACTTLITHNKDHILTNSVILAVLPRLKESLSCISITMSIQSPEQFLAPGSQVRLHAPPSISGSFGSVISVSHRDRTVLVQEQKDPPTCKTDISDLISKSLKYNEEQISESCSQHGNYFVRLLDVNAVMPYSMHGMHAFQHGTIQSEYAQSAMQSINKSVKLNNEHLTVHGLPKLLPPTPSIEGKEKIECSILHLVTIALVFTHATLTALHRGDKPQSSEAIGGREGVDEKEDRDTKGSSSSSKKVVSETEDQHSGAFLDIKPTLLALLSDLRQKLVRCVQRAVQTNMDFIELAVCLGDGHSLLDLLLASQQQITKDKPCDDSYGQATSSLAALSSSLQRVKNPLKLYPPTTMTNQPAARQPNSAYTLKLSQSDMYTGNLNGVMAGEARIGMSSGSTTNTILNAKQKIGSTAPPYTLQNQVDLQEAPIGNVSLVLPHNVQSDLALTLPPNSTAPYPYASNLNEFEQKRLALTCFAKPLVCEVTLKARANECAMTAAVQQNAAVYQQLRQCLQGSAVTLAKDAKSCLSASLPLLASRPYGIIVDTHRGVLQEEDWIHVNVGSHMDEGVEMGANGKPLLGNMSQLIVSTGVSCVLVAFCGSIEELSQHAPDHLSAQPREYYAGSAMFTSQEPVPASRGTAEKQPDGTALDLPFCSHVLGPSWPELTVQGVAEQCTSSQIPPVQNDGPTTVLVWVQLWDLDALEQADGHPLQELTSTMYAPNYSVETTGIPVIGVDLHGNTLPMSRSVPLLVQASQLQSTTIDVATALTEAAPVTKEAMFRGVHTAALWRQKLCTKWENSANHYAGTQSKTILAALLGLTASTATESLDKPAHVRSLSAALSMGLFRQREAGLPVGGGFTSCALPVMTLDRLVNFLPVGLSIAEYTSTALQQDAAHLAPTVCASRLTQYPLAPSTLSSAPWPVGDVQSPQHALSAKLLSGTIMLRSGQFTVIGDDHTEESILELVSANPQLNPQYAPIRNTPIILPSLKLAETTENVILQCIDWTASKAVEVAKLPRSRLRIQCTDRHGNFAQGIMQTPLEPPQQLQSTVTALAIRVCSDESFTCTLFHVKTSQDSMPPPLLMPNPCYIQVTQIEEESDMDAFGLLQSRFHLAPVPPKCFAQLDVLAQACIRVCQHQHTQPEMREQCQSALVRIINAAISLALFAMQANPSTVCQIEPSGAVNHVSGSSSNKYAVNQYIEALRVKAGLAVHFLTDIVSDSLRATNLRDPSKVSDEYASLIQLLGGKPPAVPASNAECVMNMPASSSAVSVDASISLAIVSQILICFMATPSCFRTLPLSMFLRSFRTEYGLYQSVQCGVLQRYNSILHHNTRVCAIPVNSTEHSLRTLNNESMALEMDFQAAEYQHGPIPGNVLSETRSYLTRLSAQGVAEPAKAVLPQMRLREIQLNQVALLLERETARTHFKLMNRERVQIQDTQWPLILGKSKLSTRQTETLISIELALSLPWGGTIAQKGEALTSEKVPLSWPLQCFSGRVFWQVENRWCAGSVAHLNGQSQMPLWSPSPFLPQEESFSIAVFADGTSSQVYPRPLAKIEGDTPVVMARLPICPGRTKLSKPVPDQLKTVSPYLSDALHRSLQLLSVAVDGNQQYYLRLNGSKPLLPSPVAMWSVALPKVFSLDHSCICILSSIAHLSAPVKTIALPNLQPVLTAAHSKHRVGDQLTSKRIPQVNRIQTAAYLLHIGFLRACSPSYARISETYASTVLTPRVLMECIPSSQCPAVNELTTIPPDPLAGFSDVPVALEPEKPLQHVSPLIWDNDKAQKEAVVQAEIDAFALLDTGLYSPWYKLFSYLSPQAVLPIDEHSKQVVNSQTPLALLLLPQKKKRMRLLECYQVATARIHADNTPVVKLEQPLRLETSAHTESIAFPKSVPKILWPSTSQSIPDLHIVPLVPQASHTRDTSRVGPDNDNQPTPEPLIVQLCRRQRDARCHHLRSTPAQYALRVLLIGNAHAGSVGYPGPYRTVISELATQLKESAELDTMYGARGVSLNSSAVQVDTASLYGDEQSWEEASAAVAGHVHRGLVSTHPQLLQQCSNGQEHQGVQRTAASPQQSSVSPGELHLWLTLGCIMGLCIRTGTALDIDITEEFWRLVHQGEPLTHELSLEQEDGTCLLQSQGLEHLRCLDRDEKTNLLNVELVSWDHGFHLNDNTMSDSTMINPMHCVRWSRKEETGIQALAHSSLSHARTLTFEQGGVPFTPETFEFSGIDSLVLPIDRGQRNIYIGQYGSSVKLTYAQRRAYTVASLKHLGMLPQLPQVPLTGSNYTNSLAHSLDLLFPLPWIGHSCYGPIVSAVRAGMFMVLPNIAYDMASLRDKRTRTFAAIEHTQKYLSEGVMQHLFTANEFRQLITGARRVDLHQLRSTATVRHVNDPSDASVKAKSLDVEKWFWEVLQEMDDDNKSRFVHFIWGSKQLPPNLAKDNVHLTMQVVNHVDKDSSNNSKNDKRLPTAHTCFMILEVPMYSTKELLLQQLMQALECQGVNF